MVREVFVADTDEEAWKLSAGDMMGRMMGEYFLPLLGHFGFKDYLKHAPDVPDSDVTVEYCARATGSSARLRPSPRRSRRSTMRSAASACCWCSASTTSTSQRRGDIRCELLQQEVMPRLKHLGRTLEGGVTTWIQRMRDERSTSGVIC